MSEFECLNFHLIQSIWFIATSFFLVFSNTFMSNFKRYFLLVQALNQVKHWFIHIWVFENKTKVNEAKFSSSPWKLGNNFNQTRPLVMKLK